MATSSIKNPLKLYLASLVRIGVPLETLRMAIELDLAEAPHSMFAILAQDAIEEMPGKGQATETPPALDSVF